MVEVMSRGENTLIIIIIMLALARSTARKEGSTGTVAEKRDLVGKERGKGEAISLSLHRVDHVLLILYFV